MKLKCCDHQRRVITGSGVKFLHRNGDGVACTSRYAEIGGTKYTAKEISQLMTLLANTSR
jgi:hypothetical protein